MRNAKLAILLFMITLLHAGCTSYRDLDGSPVIEGIEETRLDETHANHRFRAAEAISSWWETLGDDELNGLVNSALENNKDVDIAIARFLEARGIAREVGLDRYPTVGSSGSGQRKRTSGEIGAGDSQSQNNYELGFDARWEVDLFGRVAEQVKAAESRSQAAQDSLRDVYVVIAAEVARTFVELRGAQLRVNIAKRNTENQEETLNITQRLVAGGRGTQLDVTRALAQLHITRASIPTLHAQITASINRLSVLIGQLPHSLTATLEREGPLPTIPEVVNVGNVSDLLRRRPDIAEAESNLKAAVADYNVAVADQFPQVDISGALGFAASSLSGFGASALVGSIGPNVSWSAFDMGRVKAQIKQNDARAQAAVATYEKTVLEALEELQTSISDFSREEERRNGLRSAAYSAAEAERLAKIRYETGIDSFIEVLTAQSTLLETQDSLAQADIEVVLDLIAVYKALGGGWEMNGQSIAMKHIGNKAANDSE